MLTTALSFELDEFPAPWHSVPQLGSFRTTTQQIITIPKASNIKTLMEVKPEIFLSIIQSRVRPKSTKYQKTRVKPRPHKSLPGEHVAPQKKLHRWNMGVQKYFLLQPDSSMFDLQWQKGFSLPVLKLGTLHKTLYSSFIDKTTFAHMMKIKRYYSLKFGLWKKQTNTHYTLQFLHIPTLNKSISCHMPAKKMCYFPEP